MTTLIFKGGGYEVATTAWTASTKGGSSPVDIAYVWGADRISFFESATGICRVSFNLTMTQFLSRKRGDIIDLR